MAYGLLYEVSTDDEAQLDIHEGVPFAYEKQVHAIEHLTKDSEEIDTKEEVQALVYVDVRNTEPHLQTTSTSIA